MYKPGDTLLVLGATYLEDFRRDGLVPKNRTIGSLSNTVHEFSGRKVIFSQNPWLAKKDYSVKIDVQWAFNLALRYESTGSPLPKVGVYRYVDDYSVPIAGLRKIIEGGQVPPVSVDLETIGLNEFDPKAWIESISITYKKGESWVIRFRGPDNQPWEKVGDVYQEKKAGLAAQLKWLFTSNKIKTIGANFKYDIRWIREKWGQIITNFIFDTTLVGSLLDENASNSLNTHAKRYTLLGGYDDSFNQKYDKGRMDLVPDGDFLTYAGGDTDAVYQVRERMISLLIQDKRLTNFYIKLLHPAVRAFEGIEREGVLIDFDYFLKLQQELTEEIHSLTEQAKRLMSKHIVYRYLGYENDGRPKFRLSRGAIIKQFMFGPRGLRLTPKVYTQKAKSKTWEYSSTADDHLKMFSDVPEAQEFVALLKEYGSATKTLSTYVDGFLQCLKQDGRFHPTFLLYKGSFGNDEEGGTVTGRSSAKDPAVQTLPKHTKYAPKLRRGYPAPKKFVIAGWDVSQGELRIAAVMARALKMIELFNKGYDQHAVSGGRAAGYTEDEMMQLKVSDLKKFKKIRATGKPMNFGLIYKITLSGLIEFAWSTYKQRITEAEAQKWMDAFFDLHPEFLRWHDEQIMHAQNKGYVRSPLGRVRHLPLINSSDMVARSKSERQAINSPVQATLSDLVIYSAAKFREKYGEPDECRLFMFTHDDIKAYVREDKIDYWVPAVKDLMENLPLEQDFGWEVPLKFRSDAEIGYNLRDMTEIAEEADWEAFGKDPYQFLKCN
ncbi:MAG: hypothetical protein GWN00_01120 [Aliifodinibius sp.]|nr:hypothetical protein [Fodinibius sp.]NIV09932.1 hypothetical protein [Fodinibius sp.]NIY23462.1 hypothetical protein [Fodinibius sp.]